MSSAETSSRTVTSPPLPKATASHLLRSRGLALVRVAVLYQLLLVVAVTPVANVADNLAIRATGASAVINSTIVRLLTSPLSIALLAVSALIGLAASTVASGASCFAVLEGEERAGRTMLTALRHLGSLLSIALWGLWRALVMSMPPALLAGAAYLAVFGLRGPVAAYARNSSALITIGACLGVALALLWYFLFVRWIFATPLFVDGGYRGRASLDRSWELTSGLWFRFGLALAAVQIGLALAGALITTLIRTAAVQAGLGGISVQLGLLLGLSALTTVLTATAVAVSFQALTLSRYLRAIASPLPAARAEKVASSSWRLAFAVLGIAALTGLAGTAEAFVLLQSPADVAGIEIIAHRAGEAYAPENTLAAVKTARQDKAGRLEFDVQRTSDDVIVVIHDADLMRIAGKDVAVASSTLAQLQQIDIGSRFDPKYSDQRIPTLEQFLDAAGDTPLALEIKTHSKDKQTTREVVALLQKRGAIDRTVLISLDPELTALAHSLDPKLRTGDLVSISLGQPFTLPSEIIAPSSGIASAQFVATAHATGKKVWVWTLDDEALVQAAALRGVDGIITSDVPATRRALEGMGGFTRSQMARQRLMDMVSQ